MHASKSETTEILETIQKIPRIRIRINRVENNLENDLKYEDLIRINCDRFLNSTTVHQWLSEWSLCKRSSSWRKIETVHFLNKF